MVVTSSCVPGRKCIITSPWQETVEKMKRNNNLTEHTRKVLTNSTSGHFQDYKSPLHVQ